MAERSRSAHQAGQKARVRKRYVEFGSGGQGRLGTLEEHERRITPCIDDGYQIPSIFGYAS